MKKILFIFLNSIAIAGFSQFTGGIGDGYSMKTGDSLITAPDITVNSPICAGTDNDTIKLEANTVSGANYTWYGPNGFTSNDEDPVILNAVTAMSGEYFLYISKFGIISDTVNIMVDVDTLPILPSNPSGNDFICTGTTITSYFASSPNADSYLWEISPAEAASFIGDSTTTTVTLQWNTSYSGEAFVRVAGVTNCGTSNFSETSVLLYPVLGNANFTIEYDSLCQGTAQSIYYANTTEYGDYYQFSAIPNTAASLTTSNDTSVIVDWNTTYFGNVSIVVLAINDCDTTSDTIAVVINELPAASVIEDDAVCLGQNISIGSDLVSGSLYSWTSVPADPSLVGQENEPNPSVSPLVNTVYYLTETNAALCQKMDSVLIAVLPLTELPSAIVGEDSIITNNNPQEEYSTSSTNATGYIWTIEPEEAGEIIGGNNATITVSFNLFEGTIILSVRAYNDCDTTSAETLSINATFEGIAEQMLFEGKIFPNPAQEILNIELKEFASSISVEIYNNFGTLVKNEKFANTKNIKLSIDELASGIYTLKILNNDKLFTKKFVKE